MSKSTKEFSIRNLQWKLFLLGLFKIPIIGFVRPRLEEINDETVKVKIKLNRKSKNHLNSMYFGALAVGADIAGGIHVFYFSDTLGKKISFSFKGMKADFIKRAETDVQFICSDGQIIHSAVLESIETKERVNKSVMVTALDTNNEIVATFEMIASLKVNN